MKNFIALLMFALASASAAYGEMALNSAVTSENIAETICVRGYTKTIRPPVTYTNRIKRKLMKDLGIPWSDASLFELDHLVPLTIGGNPRSLDNLRLQAWEPPPITLSDNSTWIGDDSAKVKDKLEVRLNRLVCDGEMELLEAQKCIYFNWQDCAEQNAP